MKTFIAIIITIMLANILVGPADAAQSCFDILDKEELVKCINHTLGR